MDKLFINELRVETIIGCLPWEKQCKQPVILDIEIGIDCKKVGDTDELSSTNDYSALTEQIDTFMQQNQFNLIETLVEKTSAYILSIYDLEYVRLRLTKPNAIPNAKSVTVEIERNKTI